jgi:hypothetical protein
MTGFGSGGAILGSFVDGDAILEERALYRCFEAW